VAHAILRQGVAGGNSCDCLFWPCERSLYRVTHLISSHLIPVSPFPSILTCLSSCCLGTPSLVNPVLNLFLLTSISELTTRPFAPFLSHELQTRTCYSRSSSTIPTATTIQNYDPPTRKFPRSRIASELHQPGKASLQRSGSARLSELSVSTSRAVSIILDDC
jgi:hypothetical protein